MALHTPTTSMTQLPTAVGLLDDDDASLNILKISKVLYRCLGSEGHKGTKT
jgi:hypothetical protein